MAGITRLAVGHDASYPFRQMGEPATPAPVDYYLSAVEKGEPPGVWTGAGVAALGFTVGQQVDRAAFETLYGQFVNPRTGERLGRKPQDFERTADVIYQELLRAEPEATARRRMELRRLAEHQARQPVHYWDATFNPSKSITVAWLQARAAAITAAREGDAELAAEWRQVADLVWAAVMKGNAAILAHYQEKAGVTRAGRHGGRRTAAGDSAGMWEDARQWVIGSFRQHTSRDGDPHLHVHNLILHVVVRESDGQWRRLDGNALVRFRREANAVGVAVMEEELSRTLGVRWVPRKDGHGLEIAGISQEVMDLFSTRRDTITAQQQLLAAEYRQEYGREPDARTLEQMRQRSNFQTRKGKEAGPLDIPEKLHDWEQRTHTTELGTLSEGAYRMMDAWREIHRQEETEAQARDTLAAQVARGIAAQFQHEHGRATDESAAASMFRFARFVTSAGTEAGPYDAAALLRAWRGWQERDAEKERDIRRGTARAEAQAQAQRRDQDAAQAQAQARITEPDAAAQAQFRRVPVHPAPRPDLTPAQQRRLMAEGLAAAQTAQTAWTRADLMSHLGEKAPQGARVDGALDRLADRVLTGGAGEYVALLSAPEWPRVPDGLRRANGDSKFRPTGAELYAAQAQITLEERLMSDARGIGAPRLEPQHAAQLLGADVEQLQAWLRAGVTTSEPAQAPGCGLRPDQAAAAWWLLTSPRRAEVMTGPAGSGKTRTATEMARIWGAAGMGPVVALTTSSNARNVVRREAADNGVAMAAYNTAEWLGHTREAREARPPAELTAGSLIILDEAGMMSIPDIAAVLRRAAGHGCKVVLTGDTAQIPAIEGGGAMAMMSRQKGHVLLNEALRFGQPWERSASLRLRTGDVTVLGEYAEHGRLYGGGPEEMMEAAARAFLADYLEGGDPILMAATEERAAELARRVRDDLVRWGVVDNGGTIDLRGGYRASRGDLIMARRNDKTALKGNPDGGITNRDVLQLTGTDPEGTGTWAEVRKLLDYDPVTGERQWTEPFWLSRNYLRNDCHLGYAVTVHAGQGQTRGTGYAVFTGQEDLQALYPAMTRGAHSNCGFFFTREHLYADPQPGTEPAPELARQAVLDREHAGLAEPPGPAKRDITAAAAQIMERDGTQLSATETRAAAWADADRLDLLNVQWQHVTRAAAQRRYEAAAAGVLTPAQMEQVKKDPAAQWLWRSLREAEAAGLNMGEVLDRAMARGSLAGAESVAKVVDWRIRQQITRLPALPARPLAEQVPATGDPDMDRYARELAEAMNDRQRRLGEHAAETQPLWIRQGLGPVPADPLARADWEHNAGLIEKYRETWGYAHPGDPIGPRPGQHSPDAAQDWQAAADALTRRDGIDLSALTDGQLWARRAMFERETAWAPPYPAAELETTRKREREAHIRALRADMEARAATSADMRDRHTQNAANARAGEALMRDHTERLAAIADTYAEWEAVTETTRRYALAADAELRRRPPSQHVPPLQAQLTEPGTIEPENVWAEPTAAELTRRHPGQHAAQVIQENVWLQPTLDGSPRLPQPATPEPGAAPTEPPAAAQIPGQMDLAEAERRAGTAQEKIADMLSTRLPAADPDAESKPAWQEAAQRQREAVLQPPSPHVPEPDAHPYYQHLYHQRPGTEPAASVPHPEPPEPQANGPEAGI